MADTEPAIYEITVTLQPKNDPTYYIENTTVLELPDNAPPYSIARAALEHLGPGPEGGWALPDEIRVSWKKRPE